MTLVTQDFSAYLGHDWREPAPPTDPGFTCWSGIIVAVYRDLLDVTLSPWSTVPPRNLRAVAAAIEEERVGWAEVAPGEERPFDVILLRPCHTALVVTKGRMLHVQPGLPSCVESYRGGIWASRVLGFYRLA